MGTRPSIGSCPICLNDVAPQDEAFIATCLHHFCFQACLIYSNMMVLYRIYYYYVSLYYAVPPTVGR